MEPNDSLPQSLWRAFPELVECPFFEVSVPPLTLRLLNQNLEYLYQFSYSCYMYHPIFLGSVTIAMLGHEYKLWWSILLYTCPTFCHFLLHTSVYISQRYDSVYPHKTSDVPQMLHGYLEDRKISLCQIASSPTPNPTLGTFLVLLFMKNKCVMWPCSLRTAGICTNARMAWASHVYVEFFIVQPLKNKRCTSSLAEETVWVH
jgi:hypothetical protein